MFRGLLAPKITVSFLFIKNKSMNKFHFLSFILWAVAIWGIWAFALNSNYLKSDGTPDFQALKSTSNDNRLNAEMRDALMDGLTKMDEKINQCDKKIHALGAWNVWSSATALPNLISTPISFPNIDGHCQWSYTTYTHPEWETPACYEEREIEAYNGNRYHGGWWPTINVCIQKPTYTTKESCEQANFERWYTQRWDNGCEVIWWIRTTQNCSNLQNETICNTKSWCSWTASPSIIGIWS